MGQKGDGGIFAIVNLCDITAQLGSRADPDHVRTVQRGPEGRQSSTGVNRWEECVCVMCVRPENREGKRHMEKQITQLHLGALESGGAGKISRQRYKQINRGHLLIPRCNDTHMHQHTHIRTLWSHSKYISTWTSIQLPCLCNVSFTEPGPLANSRTDPVFISGWKDGVEEHPPSWRKREI